MKMRAHLGLIWGIVLVAGCAAPGDTAPTPAAPTEAAPFVVASEAFDHEAAIPVEHTCDGADVSPPLRVTGAPAAATHLALIMYDPDAPIPQAPTRNITHWVIWNVPLVEGNATFAQGEVPEASVEGAAENGERGYMGPCPPPLSTAHRYVFWAFALDAPLALDAGASRAELESALRGHVLAEGALVGTYARAIPPQGPPS